MSIKMIRFLLTDFVEREERCSSSVLRSWKEPLSSILPYHSREFTTIFPFSDRSILFIFSQSRRILSACAEYRETIFELPQSRERKRERGRERERMKDELRFGKILIVFRYLMSELKGRQNCVKGE